MKQSDGTIPPESLPNLTDRELWRRSRTMDLAENDAAHFLDLAGFADGLLDFDDQERTAELLVRDAAGRADIAAARALAAAGEPPEAVPEALVAWVVALAGSVQPVAVPPAEPGPANVIPLSPRPGRRLGLSDLASWGSLAAAVVLASWLGFTLGMDMSRSLATSRNGDDGGLNELFDPTARLIRDLTDNTQA